MVKLLLDGVAERYLRRRGRFVLPRHFIGFAIGGYGQAIDNGTHYELSWPVPTNLVDVIAVNHSMVIARPKDE